MKIRRQASDFQGSGAELARAFGISDTTVRRYVDVLTYALVLS